MESCRLEIKDVDAFKVVGWSSRGTTGVGYGIYDKMGFGLGNGGIVGCMGIGPGGNGRGPTGYENGGAMVIEGLTAPHGIINLKACSY